MSQKNSVEDILSMHRLADASPGLRERILTAADDAWNEEETPEGAPVRSPWWQFAAAAALVLFVGLNAVHSAANLTSAPVPTPPPITKMADAEALAEAIGIAPNEVKRMLLLGSQND